MITVGKRIAHPLVATPTSTYLRSNIEFSADLTKIADGKVFFPKGVFRYASHEEANAHQEACLAEGIALLAMSRQNA